VSKIYIYREFRYWEIKEAGVVREEVLIPKIAKGDLNLPRHRVLGDQGRRVGRQEVLAHDFPKTS
jgi:hypothetical protein